MADKKAETAVYTVEIPLDTIIGLGIAERKNAIEQAFNAMKEKAVIDLAKKLH